MSGHWLVLLALAVRTVTVPAGAESPVHIRCPAEEATRIVFPEPLRQLKASAEDRRRFGIVVERTQPTGVVTVRPEAKGGTVRIEFRGPARVLEVVLEATRPETPAPMPRATATAAPTETAPLPTPTIYVPPTPVPTVEATPTVTLPVAPAPVATPSPTPATPGPSDLLWAKPVAIGRREGLPGQRPMVLVDALSGQDSIWLRFRLEGGADTRVARVSWEHGDVSTFEEVKEGKDSRVVVRLPRAQVTSKTRVAVEVAGGPTYRFALSAPTLARLLRSLFQ